MKEILQPPKPEELSSEDRLKFWEQKALDLYEYCQSNNIPIIFRGSLHAHALKPGFISDGYKPEKKHWRDLDIYLPTEKISQEIVYELEKTSYPIPIGLSGNGVMRLINGGYFLCYKNIKVKIASELFEPVFLKVGEKTLPFFDPQVHAHLFGTVGFAHRARDKSKRQLYLSVDSKYQRISEEEYKGLFDPFRKFRLLRFRKYPTETILHKIRGNFPEPKNSNIRTLSRKFFNSLDNIKK